MINEKVDITKSQWKELLKNSSIFTEKDIHLLNLVLSSVGNMCTAKQLTLLLNLSSHAPINGQVGKLGRMIAEHLALTVSYRDNGTPRWWHVLFLGERTKEGFYWILRPELKSAMEELGNEEEITLLAKDDNIPEEIQPGEVIQLYEGSVKQITVNSYERNTVARIACINHYKPRCVICGFDFEEKYGEIGKNVIHVHHLKPLSEIKQNYKVNYKADLRPVCPNCHVILHKKNPPFSIEEVKEMLKSRSVDSGTDDV